MAIEGNVNIIINMRCKVKLNENKIIPINPGTMCYDRLMVFQQTNELIRLFAS
jgi:hypothetical protein